MVGKALHITTADIKSPILMMFRSYGENYTTCNCIHQKRLFVLCPRIRPLYIMVYNFNNNVQYFGFSADYLCSKINFFFSIFIERVVAGSWFMCLWLCKNKLSVAEAQFLFKQLIYSSYSSYLKNWGNVLLPHRHLYQSHLGQTG